MTVADLQKRIDDCTEGEWVDPSQIEDFNVAQELIHNKKRWNNAAEEADKDSPSSVIEYYLSCCITAGEIQNKLLATPIEILKVAFYLMIEAGISTVAFTWPAHRNIFPETQAEEIMHYMQSSFEKTKDLFTRYLVLEFILDFYKYGPMWVNLNEEENPDVFDKISNEPHQQNAFAIYMCAVGDLRNIGNLFHQNKMTDDFIKFLGALYVERRVLQSKLEENSFTSH